MSVNLYRRASLALLPFLVLLLSVLPAAAQQSPTLTASATGSPSIWRIQGSGFAPGTQLRVLEITCGQLPCGGDTTAFAAVTVGADGRFSADLDFRGLTPRTGRTTFLVSAFPITRAGEASDPTVEVPGSAGTAAPSPPATGNALEPTPANRDTRPLAMVLLSATVALGATALLRRGRQPR